MHRLCARIVHEDAKAINSKSFCLSVMCLAISLLGCVAATADDDDVGSKDCVREIKRVYQPYGDGGGSFVEVPVMKCEDDADTNEDFSYIYPPEVPEILPVNHLTDGIAKDLNWRNGCKAPSEDLVRQYAESLKPASLAKVDLVPQVPPPPFPFGQLCFDLAALDDPWFHWNQDFWMMSAVEHQTYRIAAPLAELSLPEGPFLEGMEGSYYQKWLIVRLHLRPQGEAAQILKRLSWKTPEAIQSYFRDGFMRKVESQAFSHNNILVERFQFSRSYPRPEASDLWDVPTTEYLISPDLNIICNISDYFQEKMAYLEKRKMDVNDCWVYDQASGVFVTIMFPKVSTENAAQIVSATLDAVRSTIVMAE